MGDENYEKYLDQVRTRSGSPEVKRKREEDTRVREAVLRDVRDCRDDRNLNRVGRKDDESLSSSQETPKGSPPPTNLRLSSVQRDIAAVEEEEQDGVRGEGPEKRPVQIGKNARKRKYSSVRGYPTVAAIDMLDPTTNKMGVWYCSIWIALGEYERFQVRQDGNIMGVSGGALSEVCVRVDGIPFDSSRSSMLELAELFGVVVACNMRLIKGENDAVYNYEGGGWFQYRCPDDARDAVMNMPTQFWTSGPGRTTDRGVRFKAQFATREFLLDELLPVRATGNTQFPRCDLEGRREVMHKLEGGWHVPPNEFRAFDVYSSVTESLQARKGGGGSSSDKGRGKSGGGRPPFGSGFRSSGHGGR